MEDNIVFGKIEDGLDISVNFCDNEVYLDNLSTRREIAGSKIYREGEIFRIWTEDGMIKIKAVSQEDEE